jgi:hypothetical protein
MEDKMFISHEAWIEGIRLSREEIAIVIICFILIGYALIYELTRIRGKKAPLPIITRKMQVASITQMRIKKGRRYSRRRAA